MLHLNLGRLRLLAKLFRRLELRIEHVELLEQFDLSRELFGGLDIARCSRFHRIQRSLRFDDPLGHVLPFGAQVLGRRFCSRRCCLRLIGNANASRLHRLSGGDRKSAP